MNAQLVRRAKQADILRAVNSQRVNALQRYQEDATGILGMRLNAQYNNWANTWLRYHPPEIPSVRIVDTEVHENDEGDIVRVQALLSERKRQEALEQRELSIQEKLNAILGDHNKKPSGQKPEPRDHFNPPTAPMDGGGGPPPSPSPDDGGDDDDGTDGFIGHAGQNLDVDTHGNVGAPRPVNDPAAEHKAALRVKDEAEQATLWMLQPHARGRDTTEPALPEQEGPSSILAPTTTLDPVKEEELIERGAIQPIPIPPDVLNRETAFQAAREAEKEAQRTIWALEAEIQAMVAMGADPTPILNEIRLVKFELHAERIRQGGALALQEMREAFAEAGELAREQMGTPAAREVREQTMQTETVANSVAIQAGTALRTTQAAVQAGLITREEGMQTEVEILQQATADYEEVANQLEARTRELALTQRQRDFLLERGQEAERVINALQQEGEELVQSFRPRALEMARVMGQRTFEDVQQRMGADLSRAQETNRELTEALTETGVELNRAQQQTTAFRGRVQGLIDERTALTRQILDLEARLREAGEGNVFVVNDVLRLRGIVSQREAELQAVHSDLSAAAEREIFLRDSFQQQQAVLEETIRVAEREIAEAGRLAAAQVEEVRLQAQSAAAQAQRLALALEEEQRQARAALLAEGQARQLQAQVQREELAQLEQQRVLEREVLQQDLNEAQQRLQNRRRRRLRQGSRTLGPEFFGAGPAKRQRR